MHEGENGEAGNKAATFPIVFSNNAVRFGGQHVECGQFVGPV